MGHTLVYRDSDSDLFVTEYQDPDFAIRFIIFSNFIYQNFNLILEIRPWPWSATVIL